MTKISFPLVLLLTGMVASLGQAQAPASNYEHLKPLEWLIGEWVWESTADEAITGVAEVGDKVTGSLQCEWQLDKNIIASRIQVVANGVTIFDFRGTVGYDRAAKQIIGRSFDSLGGSGQSVYTKSGDEWHIKASGANPEGKRTTGTTVVSNISKDGFRVQAIEQTEDGQDLEDEDAIELTRKK